MASDATLAVMLNIGCAPIRDITLCGNRGLVTPHPNGDIYRGRLLKWVNTSDRSDSTVVYCYPGKRKIFWSGLYKYLSLLLLDEVVASSHTKPRPSQCSIDGSAVQKSSRLEAYIEYSPTRH